MPPVEPKKRESKTDKAPVFKSYFELLEAKYAEDEAPAEPAGSTPAAAKKAKRKEKKASESKRDAPESVANDAAGQTLEVVAARAEASPPPHQTPPRIEVRGPGGGRRKEGRQWLVTFVVLAALGLSFIGVMRWVSKDWWENSTPAATDSPEAVPADPGAAAGAAGDDGATPAGAETPSARPAPSSTPEPAEGEDGPSVSVSTSTSAGSSVDAAEAPPQDASSAGAPALEPSSPDPPSPTPPSPGGESGRDGAGAASSPAVEAQPTVAPASGTTRSPSDGSGAAETTRAAASGTEGGASTSPSVQDEVSSTPVAAPVPDAVLSTGYAASDVSVGAGQVRARKVFAPQPAYPEQARRRSEQGTVTVRGIITAQGDVRDATVVEGVSTALDRAALEAFRTWQFLPAKRGDRPVESAYRVAFNFQFDAASEPAPSAPRRFPAPPPVESDGTGPAPPAMSPLAFGGDFTPPARWVTPLPTYPQSERASGVEGDVVLALVVEANGSVFDVAVLEGLSPPLDEAALEAVRQWRFRPATQDGVPVRVEHRVTLRFVP